MDESAGDKDTKVFLSEISSSNDTSAMDEGQGQEQNESNDNKMKALTKIKGKRGRPSKVQDCSKENNHCKCCAKFAEQKIADRKKARAQSMS